MAPQFNARPTELQLDMIDVSPWIVKNMVSEVVRVGIEYLPDLLKSIINIKLSALFHCRRFTAIMIHE